MPTIDKIKTVGTLIFYNNIQSYKFAAIYLIEPFLILKINTKIDKINTELFFYFYEHIFNSN